MNASFEPIVQGSMQCLSTPPTLLQHTNSQSFFTQQTRSDSTRMVCWLASLLPARSPLFVFAWVLDLTKCQDMQEMLQLCQVYVEIP